MNIYVHLHSDSKNATCKDYWLQERFGMDGQEGAAKRGQARVDELTQEFVDSGILSSPPKYTVTVYTASDLAEMPASTVQTMPLRVYASLMGELVSRAKAGF